MSQDSGKFPPNSNIVPNLFNKPFDSVSSDISGAEFQLIRNTGIKFMHYAAVADPLFKHDDGGIRHSFDQEELQQFEDRKEFHRENGFLFFKRGIVYGIWANNTKDLKYLTSGLYTSAGATISLDRYYADSNKHVELSENDKLVPIELPTEFYTTLTHKFRHNPTGIDRLQFPAYNISTLIDSSGILYNQGIDFTLDRGTIKWVDGKNRPGIDPEVQNGTQGKICAARFTYRPYYFIKMILHDIRIKPALNAQPNNPKPKAGPILAQIVADWVYLLNNTSNPNAPDAQLESGDTPDSGPR